MRNNFLIAFFAFIVTLTSTVNVGSVCPRRAAVNANCTRNDDCKTHICGGNICICAQMQGACDISSNCCANSSSCFDGKCLSSLDGPCLTNADCISGACHNNIKCACVPLKSTCKISGNCCKGLLCFNEQCLSPLNGPCNSIAECISGNCEQGNCICGKNGDDCSFPDQCCSHGCDMGKCKANLNDICRNTRECGRGFCQGGKCLCKTNLLESDECVSDISNGYQGDCCEGSICQLWNGRKVCLQNFNRTEFRILENRG